MPPKQNSQGKGSGPQVSGKVASRPAPANPGQSNKKRPGPASNNAQQNPRAAKRSKIYEARSIAVQSPHAALKDGELNVQSFVDSMAFQINALDEGMRRSRTSGTSRAFQRVPFVLRRRTAAHNYKRVPKRLHKRAKYEMAEDNTPTVNSRTKKPKTSRARLRASTARKLGILAKKSRRLKASKGDGADGGEIVTRVARPKIRRNEPNELPITAPRYRKRQLNKIWLPTHMWHAKRARMAPPSEPLWGFSIPVTPNQKNYRPTHRAQWEKGAMIWDMSYTSTIGLFGKENIVENILKDMGLTLEALWGEKGLRWRKGAVHWTGNLSRKIKNTAQFIGPATILWNPKKVSETPETETPSRQLFIRIHPSAFFETFNELLRLIKGYTPRPYIQDLRHEIGSIDITGPDSTEALLGVLKAFQADSKEGHFSKFESLLGLRDPASLPLGALLAFSVRDPRLSYPPQKVQIPESAGQQGQLKLMESISTFRNGETLEPYQLFNRDARFKAASLPSQKSLNLRRGKTGPGVALEPSPADPPIPIILLASRNANESQIPGTWTLLLPWKCVQPVWLSLVHFPLSTGGNPAFGGLDEARQLAFERGQPWFPGDMPGTDAGNAWETKERETRHRAWARRPKGKRTQWESLDLGAGRKGEVGVGWSCDFETLFRLRNSVEKKPALLTNEPASEDHEMADASEMSNPNAEKKKSQETSITAPLTAATYLPKSLFTTLTTQPPSSIPSNALITVRITLLGRGTISTCARIYRLPTPTKVPSPQAPPPPPNPLPLPPDLKAQWLATKPRKRKRAAKSLSASSTAEARQQALAAVLVGSCSSIGESTNGAHPLCPDARDLIGFVTTGAFSLRHGRGEGIAALGARGAAEELGRHGTSHAAARVCVVRDAGVGVGWLARWDVV